MIEDTIVAIATPLVPSAIGIIRVSGPQSKKIVETLFKVRSTVHRRMTTKTAYDVNNSVLDDCCFTFYNGPESYTGEDMIEIFCHGSTYIMNEMMQLIASLDDCRVAKNGEFTKRAFLNGKIPLSKAESILDIIESTSKDSHCIALAQYKGHVYQLITTCRKDIMVILEHIEASLEFPDDVGNVNFDEINGPLTQILNELHRIIEVSDYGLVLKKGLRYLIVGAPNVGKSSIMNMLCGEDRSIVNASEGTTRDYIDVCIQYNGMPITLIDTAGIRNTEDAIEKIGIEKIKELSNDVDGYIFVEDNSGPFFPPPFIIENKPIIRVINKVDLFKKSSELPPKLDAVQSNLNHISLSASPKVFTSCLTGEGFTDLKEKMTSLFIEPSKYAPERMLCNLRQISALKTAYAFAKKAQTNLENSTTLDIVSIDLRASIEALSDIMGDHFTESLLDGIFSKFCIGK
jgi:tRNA modification GTPase